MSKTTLRNIKASVEASEIKNELNEAELKTVSGGSFKIYKYLDKASPKLF